MWPSRGGINLRNLFSAEALAVFVAAVLGLFIAGVFFFKPPLHVPRWRCTVQREGGAVSIARGMTVEDAGRALGATGPESIGDSFQLRDRRGNQFRLAFKNGRLVEIEETLEWGRKSPLPGEGRGRSTLPPPSVDGSFDPDECGYYVHVKSPGETLSAFAKNLMQVEIFPTKDCLSGLSPEWAEKIYGDQAKAPYLVRLMMNNDAPPSPEGVRLSRNKLIFTVAYQKTTYLFEGSFLQKGEARVLSSRISDEKGNGNSSSIDLFYTPGD